MNVLASILRTAVPLLAGWILTVTGAVGVEVDSATLAGGVTAALTVAYYVTLRALEVLAERIGWEPLRLVAGLLLGWARPPQYETPAAGTSAVRVHLDWDALRADIGTALQAAARDVGEKS